MNLLDVVKIIDLEVGEINNEYCNSHYVYKMANGDVKVPMMACEDVEKMVKDMVDACGNVSYVTLLRCKQYDMFGCFSVKGDI